MQAGRIARQSLTGTRRDVNEGDEGGRIAYPATSAATASSRAWISNGF